MLYWFSLSEAHKSLLVLGCQTRARTRPRKSTEDFLQRFSTYLWSDSFQAAIVIFSKVYFSPSLQFNQRSHAAQVIKMGDTKVIDFKLYHYTPSLDAAIIFIICFSICAILHTWRTAHLENIPKKNLLLHSCPHGALCEHGTKPRHLFKLIILTVEVVGYIGSAVANSYPLALGPFIIQALLILLAPPLFAASIYMVLGRTIVLFQAEHHSIIPVK